MSGSVSRQYDVCFLFLTLPVIISATQFARRRLGEALSPCPASSGLVTTCFHEIEPLSHGDAQARNLNPTPLLTCVAELLRDLCQFLKRDLRGPTFHLLLANYKERGSYTSGNTRHHSNVDAHAEMYIFHLLLANYKEGGEYMSGVDAHAKMYASGARITSHNTKPQCGRRFLLSTIVNPRRL